MLSQEIKKLAGMLQRICYRIYITHYSKMLDSLFERSSQSKDELNDYDVRFYLMTSPVTTLDQISSVYQMLPEDVRKSPFFVSLITDVIGIDSEKMRISDMLGLEMEKQNVSSEKAKNNILSEINEEKNENNNSEKSNDDKEKKKKVDKEDKDKKNSEKSEVNKEAVAPSNTNKSTEKKDKNK